MAIIDGVVIGRADRGIGVPQSVFPNFRVNPVIE